MSNQTVELAALEGTNAFLIGELTNELVDPFDNGSVPDCTYEWGTPEFKAFHDSYMDEYVSWKDEQDMSHEDCEDCMAEILQGGLL
jgi:hypothetical protein